MTIADRLSAAGTAGLSTALRKRGYHDVFVDGEELRVQDVRSRVEMDADARP